MGLTQEQGLERDEALKNLKITTYPEGKGYIYQLQERQLEKGLSG